MAMATVNGLNTRMTATVTAKANEVATRPKINNQAQSDPRGKAASHPPKKAIHKASAPHATANSKRETDKDPAR